MSIFTVTWKALRYLECCMCVQNVGLEKQIVQKLTVKAVRLAT